LFGNDNMYYGTHYVESNIPIFLNAEFVCSVDSSLGDVGAVFGQGEGGVRKHNI